MNAEEPKLVDGDRDSCINITEDKPSAAGNTMIMMAWMNLTCNLVDCDKQDQIALYVDMKPPNGVALTEVSKKLL